MSRDINADLALSNEGSRVGSHATDESFWSSWRTKLHSSHKIKHKANYKRSITFTKAFEYNLSRKAVDNSPREDRVGLYELFLPLSAKSHARKI